MNASRIKRAYLEAARGALIGAAAGLIVALGDFGALWMWLPLWSDRGALLVRIVATLVPLGALLGAVGCAMWGAFHPAIHGPEHRRVEPLPFVAALALPLFEVARLLFSGGKMSRVPFRDAWVVVAAAGLLVGTYVAIRMAFRFARSTRELSDKKAQPRLVVILLLSFLAAKFDQHYLPNLYLYLHACLAAFGFATAYLFVSLIAARSSRLHSLHSRRPLFGLPVAGALAGVLLVNLATLDANQNVRVALFDPRAATTRSVMFALEPLLTMWSARTSAHPRHSRRLHQHQTFADLPVRPDAHVLFITVDALRADRLGVAGNRRKLTPELDALARESEFFERVYTQAPHSSYSLCSVMTSEYLHETVDLGMPLPTATLPKAFAQDDFHTAAFYTLGIFHTEGERLVPYQRDAFGFALHDHNDYKAEERTNRVLEEVDRVVARGEPRTFFWAHYFDVHEPYEDTSLGTSDVDRYDSEVRIADRAIGRLIREVRKRLSRDVIVVVSADHGEEFREHGGVYHGSTLYEEQVRVPLIISVPRLAPRTIKAQVKLIDVAPTLLELADVAVPPSMRGDDLRPLMTGDLPDIGPAYSAVLTKRMTVQWPYKLIADVRFGLFELFNLERDPLERHNLASEEPHKLEELKGELYGWMDSLSTAPHSHVAADPRQVALDQGRLGDRRSVPVLSKVILDDKAPIDMRREAGRILGRLSDPQAVDALTHALREPEKLVAAEAAIALGRMYDDRARPYLRELVYAEDPDVRTRAAVSLARLRDRAAVPGLIEALYVASSRYEREEAVRWLGRLRDPRGVEPLLSLLPEFRLRDLVVVALGLIGDVRASAPLRDMLNWETHANIREALIRGIGHLGDPSFIEPLLHVAIVEPELKTTTESLIRLDAIQKGFIGGADIVSNARGLTGFSRCEVGPLDHDWNYLNRTYCEMNTDASHIDIAVPDSVRSASKLHVVMSARRADAPEASEVSIELHGVTLPAHRVDGQWDELHWQIPAETMRDAHPYETVTIRTTGATRLDVDHVLLLPEPSQ